MGDRRVTAAPDGPTSANSTRMSDDFRTPLPLRQERNASPGSQGPLAIAPSTDDSIHRVLDGANNTVNQLGERLTSQVCVFTHIFSRQTVSLTVHCEQVKYGTELRKQAPCHRNAMQFRNRWSNSKNGIHRAFVQVTALKHAVRSVREVQVASDLR